MGKYELRDLEHDTVLELELTDDQFVELKRFLKDLKTPREHIDYKRILERFNGVCKNLPPATRLTDKRKRAITRLIKDGYDIDELFRKAAQSRFLGGDNARKWHASLDWLLIPSNAVKVIEGNYSPITQSVEKERSSFDMDDVMTQVINRYKK